MKKILIVGASSAMATETARNFARDGAEFFLTGRNKEKLQTLANDLRVRGAKAAEIFSLDLSNFSEHQKMWDAAVTVLGELDAVLIAHGSLPDQKECEKSVEKTLHEFSVNCLSVISILTIAGNYFEQRAKGCIAVISSVAGDRGRQSNYVYGAAKGAVSIFMQGLRNRLASKNISVVTIKPGFVDTPMTAHLPKNALFATAESVGKGIYSAMKNGADEVYLPAFWRGIMTVITSIPETIFKGMKL